MDKVVQVFSALVYLFALKVVSTSYLYGEWDGNFANGMRLDIWVNFRDLSDGMILYAIDSKKNTFWIRTEPDFNNSGKIIFNFNGLTFHQNAYKVDWKNRFSINLEFRNNALYNRYFTKDPLLVNLFKRNKIGSDTNIPHFVPSNFSNSTKKTFFWIGNIDSFVGLSHSNSQLIGCFEWLRVNDESLKIVQYGEDILPYCVKMQFETICKESHCNKEIRLYDILDCSLSGMNTWTNCFQDISVLSKQATSFRVIKRDRTNKIIKLAWKQRFAKNYSLIEFISKKGPLVSLQTNFLNQIMLCIKIGQATKCSWKILDTILLNVIHLLMINFRYPFIIFKISSGEHINTFIESFKEDNFVINLGISSYFQEYTTKFDGDMAFRYSPDEFKPLKQKNIKGKSKPSQFYKIFSKKVLFFFIIMTFVLITAYILGWLLKRKELVNRVMGKILSKEKKEVPISNIVSGVP